jgi:hypothetical protein
MIKKTLLSFICLLHGFLAYSQITDTVKPLSEPGEKYYFGKHIAFPCDIHIGGFWQSTSSMVSDTALYGIFDDIKYTDKKYVDSMRKAKPKAHFFQFRFPNKILLGVKLDPKLSNYVSDSFTFDTKTFAGYTITNNSKAVVLAANINKSNVNDYRYHVVENDSIEIVEWRIPKLAQAYGAKVPYAMLGEFVDPDKHILIEVVNIKDYSIRNGIVLNWKTNFKPSLSSIFVFGKNSNFDLADVSANNHLATKFNPVSHIPINFKFRLDEVNSISLNFNEHTTASYTVYLIKTLTDNKKTTTPIASIGNNETVYYLDNNYYQQPGRYELVIHPMKEWSDNQLLRIPFEVLPPLPVHQQYSIRQLLAYIIGALLVIMLLFSAYYIFNKRKLHKVNQQKELANLKLSSIRSQLNPHFMFNALTSIQNLMNNQDNAGANHYLSKFAGLTRQILESSGQELISLEDELKLITDYLQMEQLRFGFEYSIDVAPEINRANTEIPHMLLQPFVENAAKHGVSVLQNKGKIKISINRQHGDIILTVQDNGPGFEMDTLRDGGFGLKLNEERIRLLNQIYQNQTVLLNISSTNHGTTITITLTEWL